MITRFVAIRVLVFVLAGLCLAACGRKQDIYHDNKVIAKVDGVEITDKDLKQYYQTLVRAGGQKGSVVYDVNETLKKALLEKLIEKKVLLREAAKEGIFSPPGLFVAIKISNAPGDDRTAGPTAIIDAQGDDRQVGMLLSDIIEANIRVRRCVARNAGVMQLP